MKKDKKIFVETLQKDDRIMALGLELVVISAKTDYLMTHIQIVSTYPTFSTDDFRAPRIYLSFPPGTKIRKK